MLDRDDQLRLRPQVPPYQEISHEAIAAKAAEWDVAKTTLAESKRSLVEAQQELPQSQWKDAGAAETARAEGKPEPKTRTHTQQHEKRIADLEHEQRVSQLAEQRAFDALQAALDQHQAEWADQIERETAALDEAWRDAVGALTALYAQRRRTIAIRGQVIGDGRRGVQTVPLSLAQAQSRSIAVGDLLAALTDVGMPVPEPEPSPQQQRREQRERELSEEQAAEAASWRAIQAADDQPA